MTPKRRLPARTLAGETVLVEPSARQVFLMNSVAGEIWAGVVAGKSAAEIVAAVVARFAVDEPRARRDVTAYLLRLEAAGLAVRT